MELKERNLTNTLTGEDVASLHKDLVAYHYKIAEKELAESRFGDTTYDAVIDLQKKFKLPPNGIVDAKTAWLMEPGNSDHEHPNKFVVMGRVTNANGSVVEQATVRAFDKDLRSEQTLGNADSTKQHTGKYEIFYRADEFDKIEKDRADLIVRVTEQNGTVTSSPIIFNAGKVEVVDFTVGDARGLSEFESIVSQITPLMNGVVAQHQLTADDIAFLSGDTGISSDLLTLIAESARRNIEANSIAQSVFYGLFRQSLPTVLVELLQNEISLLRSALELSSNQGIIAQLSATQLDQIAQALQALKATLILAPGQPGATPSLGDLLKTSELSTARQRTVAELHVQHGGATESFWDAIDSSDFTQLEKNDVRFTFQVGDLTTVHLPLVKELRIEAPPSQMAQPPATKTSTATEDPTALRPLAVKGVAEWRAILDRPRKPVTNPPVPIGAPPNTPGATQAEKLDNYAAALNKYMEKALPTPVVVGRAVADVATDNPFKAVKTDLTTFFNKNRFYEFGQTPIDVYLSEGRDEKLSGVVNPQALIAELKNMQRLFNITPRYAEIRSLRKDALHSAVSMVKVGERRFVEKYSAPLGGSTQALEAYRKAKQTHAAALNFYLQNVLTSNSPGPFVIPNGNMKSAVTKLTSTPDLPTLFGTLDLCDCAQCQSVYSPAAYYVDILKFLADGPINNGLNPLEVLLTRRPDLEHIELTCENTSTQLPYVDLAREILEADVATRNFSIAEGTDIAAVIAALNAETIPAGFRSVFLSNGYTFTDKASVRREDVLEGQLQSWLIIDSSWAFSVTYLGTGKGFTVGAWPQTSWTSDELNANPEHINSTAYATLRSAVYPWNLPLNLPVEESRVYFGHFDLKRHEVMETFFRSNPSGVLTNRNIANEYLGITNEEADIITGVTTGGGGQQNRPWDFWGLKQTGNQIPDPPVDTAWDLVLQRVSVFTQQSGLSYRELLEILGSFFINPAITGGRTLGIVSRDVNNPTTCDLTKLEIRVVDSQITDKRTALIAVWNKIHRFVRLSRRLGWTMRDLDKAIVALQPKNASDKLDITADFLLKLSNIQRLRAQFGVPVVSLLSFWADIDTGRYLDHYSEEETTIPSLYETLFNNRAAGQSLPELPSTDKLTQHTAIISAALQISVDELTLMLADGNVVTNDNLTLANLSALYRHATFAKALMYSIRTYLSALKLINVSAFAKPDDTVKFVKQSEKIIASGFSVDDLTYILRHDFSANTPIAITDEAIAVALNPLRAELRKIAAENNFVEASDPTNPATNDPNGDLTKRKLALLNWDATIVEQLIAVLNGTYTHETTLDPLPVEADFEKLTEDLARKVAYDISTKQLRFTGVMTNAEKGALLALSGNQAYQTAVGALSDAPRNIVKRHMRRFSVPRFTAPLAALPSTLTFPDALKRKIYYDTGVKELNFIGVMTEAERKVLANLSPDPAYRTAVTSLFAQPDTTSPATGDLFIDQPDAAALFDTIPAIAPPARFILVLRKLLPYLRATLSERIVIQRIGEYLHIESKAANELLTRWVNSPTHPTQKAITEFLAAKFIDSNPKLELTRLGFIDQFKTFTLLYKIATLNHGFQLTPQQLQWLFDFGPSNTWLDLNALPLDVIAKAGALHDGWVRLADLFKLRDSISNAETLLTDVFTSTRAGILIDPLLQKISNATSWKLDNLKALNGTNGFNFVVNSYKDEAALVRLQAAFATLQHLGASADQCLSWTRVDMTDADHRKCAQDAKSLVRARLDPEQWIEKAKTLNDPLREMQRAALVSFLMVKHGVRDANELYDDFLMDVEMSPCMMTTRIKQAISSVQLFVQRSLMNLESDVAMRPEEAKQWTEWRKQYRVWEANRKILLYPENWIEPELRDGKSSFYEDLENELLQNDVTMDTAETAFLNYLGKLHEVARLEIVGLYRQVETGSVTPPIPATNVLHVIGRTFSEPHAYYYRTHVDSAYWTPWEKIDADIKGNHVIPVIWNRRLYVFWPTFSIRQKETEVTMPEPGETMARGERALEIQIAWTEYKNGKWSPKKMATPFVSPLQHPDMPLGEENFKLFSFKTRIQTTSTGEKQLFIDCYGPVDIVSQQSASTGAMQETYLFSMRTNEAKTVSASVDGRVFQASDVNNVEIVARNATSGAQLSRTRFNGAGSITITNTTGVAAKYFMASAVYRLGEIDVTGQIQICRIVPDTSPLALSGNGTGALKPAVIGSSALVAPSSIGGGIKVCDIMSEGVCEFDLISIGSAPGPITSTSPMQAIASFHFDDGQQSVRNLRSSNGISTLEPIVGTRFENMMMVEYQNPNDDGLGESRMLRKTPGTFRLLGMVHSYIPKALVPPIFFQDDLHTYFVNVPAPVPKVRFNSFYHAMVHNFFKELNHFGISGLLTLENQRLTDKKVATELPTAFKTYDPDPAKVDLGDSTFSMAPREDVDFSYGGAYSSYNWELFFHAPFMIATQLSKNQRFDEAQKWFHFIFNPTATDSPDNPSSPGPERFWRVKPLYDHAKAGTQTLEELFADSNALEAQVNEWMANPFKPHVIARMRLETYMKAVVMRYVDNLIAWGDQLFRRDTIESINEATQLYILAAQILGRRPEMIPARVKTKVQTFRSLDDESVLNSLANSLVEIEGFLSPSVMPPPVGEGEGGVPLMSFFGIPRNDKLLGYWDTVGDRLFKIRHCLNIDGVVRSLPTFEPPIDPGLLAKAASAGVDITSALTDINVGMPHYRFNIMSQKATELCNEVKALGGALLSALEKRDNEALSLLRSTHEIKVLNAVRTIREKQVDEAKEARVGLDRSKELITLRRNYYRDIAFLNTHESDHLKQSRLSMNVMGDQKLALLLASLLHLIPDAKAGSPTTIGITYGGTNIAPASSAFGAYLGTDAGLLGTKGSMAATMGGHHRRFDEWKLQERLADKELQQIDKQIAAADLRIAIAERELSSHELQVENTKEVDEFMRSKFTNRELYDWMVGQIAGIYFQSYQLAYDVAKRAERAYRYELGLRDSSFIQFGYWDSLKKGLLAGERLGYDLKRMEVAYVDQNKREYEIVKHVSLQAIDPVSLVKLKQTGECFVSLPEALFDIDYPGHYMRRIKSVGVTVPCVAGPYSGVNCTLTLQSSTVRHSNTLSNGKYGRQVDDLRFADSAGTVQSIVTSGAQNDSGMFEPNLRDDRYLPFEGQGAVSSWRIELPKNFKAFDYNTISDVVLHVRYTSREGGAVLRTQAEVELQAALNEFIRVEGKRGLAQMFSLRHDFPTEWSRFINAPAGELQSLTAAITKERFPFLFQGRPITIKAMEVIVKVHPDFDDDHNDQTMKITLAAGTTAPGRGSTDVVDLDPWHELFRGSKTFNHSPGPFTMNAWRNAEDQLNPNAIQDIVIVCRYTCA